MVSMNLNSNHDKYIICLSACHAYNTQTLGTSNMQYDDISCMHTNVCVSIYLHV